MYNKCIYNYEKYEARWVNYDELNVSTTCKLSNLSRVSDSV